MAAPSIPLDPSACQALVASPRWQARISIAEGGCWIMAGSAPAAHGYADVSLSGRAVKAHRVALVAALGRDLLPGMTAGHLCHDEAIAAGLCAATDAEPCDHRRCVRASHLGEQTLREQVLLGGSFSAVNAARMFCPAGHSIDPNDPSADLVPSEMARGHRACRQCARERSRAKHAAIRVAWLGLGITWSDYVALFGRSRQVADDIAERLAAGISPATILAGARAAMAAPEVVAAGVWLDSFAR